MFRAFSTSATGMDAQQNMVNVTANNIANINTTGFKRSQIDFQDLVYTKIREAGTEMASGIKSPSGIEVGSGVKVASTVKVFSPGELENTGRTLDVAIAGDGFLQVSMPAGSIRYTRDGALRKGPNGELMTAGGHFIEPAITIPTDATSVVIGKDGGVNISTFSEEENQLVFSVVGNIQLAKFPNPSGLSSVGNNLLAETDASGAPTVGTPGEGGLGTVESGFLEKSNVQMITELVNLITAQRAYEVSSRSIRAADEMLRKAIQMARF